MSLQRQVSLSLQRQVSTSGNLNDALEEDDARNEDRRRDDRRREAARARWARPLREGAPYEEAQAPEQETLTAGERGKLEGGRAIGNGEGDGTRPKHLGAKALRECGFACGCYTARG